MKLALLSLVLLFLNPHPHPPAARVLMDIRHAGALADAAVRTHLTGYEEAYCLLGLAQADSTYLILAVVKPQQRAEIRRVGPVVISSVYSASCPAGTIAALHTHPFGDSHPSWIDVSGWLRQDRYTLHVIAFVPDNDIKRVGMVAFDYSTPNRPRQLSGPWLHAH